MHDCNGFMPMCMPTSAHAHQSTTCITCRWNATTIVLPNSSPSLHAYGPALNTAVTQYTDPQPAKHENMRSLRLQGWRRVSYLDQLLFTQWLGTPDVMVLHARFQVVWEVLHAKRTTVRHATADTAPSCLPLARVSSAGSPMPCQCMSTYELG